MTFVFDVSNINNEGIWVVLLDLTAKKNVLFNI